MAGALTWDADVVLTDGSVAHVRAIRPEDAPAVQEMHLAQSAESRYFRFFAPVEALSERELTRFTRVDGRLRVALVVELAGHIIGIGRFDRIEDEPGLADVAFNVADAHHGRGIGSLLLEHLTAIGAELGVRRFRADVLPQNSAMIRVFMDAGYEVSHEFDDGVIAVAFDIAPTLRSAEVRAAREHRAEAASLAPVLAPRCVAVVGVSRHRDTVGRRLLAHLVAGGFTGRILALNHRAAAGEEAEGIPLLTDWSQAPAMPRPDVVVIAVPAGAVAAEVRAAGEAGARAVVIVSTGFAEAGAEGAARQDEVVRLAHAHGMRVLGPAAVGLLNPPARLNLTLAAEPPQAGRLGLFTHTGGLAVAVLDEVRRRGLGLSTFAGAGNRADISGNDLMQYWIDDDATDVVGLHLQSMGNARKFTRVARSLAARKPVVVVKPGPGVPAGHLVRRSAAGTRVMDAVLDQSGAIRAGTLRELLDIAQVALAGPLPAGRRLGTVANNPGLVTLTGDAALVHGLELTRRELVAPEASISDYLAAVDRCLADPGVDAVVACFMPPLLALGEELVRGVAASVRRHGTPCAASFLGMETGAVAGVPVLAMPEDGVAALAALARYTAWRDAGRQEMFRPPGLDRAGAAACVAAVLASAPAGRVLEAEEAWSLARAYGLGTGPEGEATVVSSGPALRVTSVEDEAFGPVVGISVAGIATELFDDVAHLVPPVSLPDVQRSVAGLRAAPLLGGPGGLGTACREALADQVGRVCVLADDLPELAGLTVDLVITRAGTVVARGLRARVAPAGPRLDGARAID